MTTTIEYSQMLDEIAKSADWHESLDSVSISRINQAAQRLRELDKPDCVWTFDEDQGMYDTGCGESWMFSEEPRLAEHSVKFCPFCAGKVKEST